MSTIKSLIESNESVDSLVNKILGESKLTESLEQLEVGNVYTVPELKQLISEVGEQEFIEYYLSNQFGWAALDSSGQYIGFGLDIEIVGDQFELSDDDGNVITCKKVRVSDGDE